MKHPTIEEIKKRYPEGCEIACVIEPDDKAIVYHEDIESLGFSGIGFESKKDDVAIYLYSNGEYAKITKAPKKLFASIKKLIKLITSSRIFKYVLFTLLYLLVYQFTNFEFTVIGALGQVIGELVYQGEQNHNNK